MLPLLMPTITEIENHAASGYSGIRFEHEIPEDMKGVRFVANETGRYRYVFRRRHGAAGNKEPAYGL